MFRSLLRRLRQMSHWHPTDEAARTRREAESIAARAESFDQTAAARRRRMQLELESHRRRQ